MNESHHPGDPGQLGNPREISKWTRVYAQNRSLPFIVFMLLFLFLSVAIGGGSYLAGAAYLKGNIPLFAVCIGLLVVAMAAVIYFSTPWGGKRMDQMSERLYSKEGRVVLASSHTAGQRRLVAFAGLGFGLCILASVILGMLGYIPDKYMQPVSAIYCVPFMVILGIVMRPAGGWLMFLWPVLYALHAILIGAGVPILFAGKWDGLNMLSPTAGYGLLSGLACHIYSRFALRKLKHLARTDLSTDDGQGR